MFQQYFLVIEILLMVNSILDGFVTKDLLNPSSKYINNVTKWKEKPKGTGISKPIFKF